MSISGLWSKWDVIALKTLLDGSCRKCNNISHEFFRWVYAPRFLSHHNKDLEWQILKLPWHVTALGSWTDRVIALRSRTDHVIALRQLSVTALFYWEGSRKIHLPGMRAHPSKNAKRKLPQRAKRQAKRERERERERKRERHLAPLFTGFFLPRPMQIGLSQECCSTRSPYSGPRTFLWSSSVLFSWAFLFLVF